MEHFIVTEYNLTEVPDRNAYAQGIVYFQGIEGLHTFLRQKILEYTSPYSTRGIESHVVEKILEKVLLNRSMKWNNNYQDSFNCLVIYNNVEPGKVISEGCSLFDYDDMVILKDELDDILPPSDGRVITETITTNLETLRFVVSEFQYPEFDMRSSGKEINVERVFIGALSTESLQAYIEKKIIEYACMPRCVQLDIKNDHRLLKKMVSTVFHAKTLSSPKDDDGCYKLIIIDTLLPNPSDKAKFTVLFDEVDDKNIKLEDLLQDAENGLL